MPVYLLAPVGATGDKSSGRPLRSFGLFVLWHQAWVCIVYVCVCLPCRAVRVRWSGSWRVVSNHTVTFTNIRSCRVHLLWQNACGGGGGGGVSEMNRANRSGMSRS